MLVTSVENPTVAAFGEYKDILKKLPPTSWRNVVWVVSILSGATEVLVDEAIELPNWLVCYGCV